MYIEHSRLVRPNYQTPRSLSKLFRYASYFQLPSRCTVVKHGLSCFDILHNRIQKAILNFFCPKKHIFLLISREACIVLYVQLALTDCIDSIVNAEKKKSKN